MAHVEMAGHTVLNTSLSEERSLESSFHGGQTGLAPLIELPDHVALEGEGVPTSGLQGYQISPGTLP